MQDLHDPDIRWIVVEPGYPADSHTVESYLYGHSRLIHTANNGFGDVCTILVLGTPGDTTRAQDRAEYLAERLRSGLHAAHVCESYADARRTQAERLDNQAVRHG